MTREAQRIAIAEACGWKNCGGERWVRKGEDAVFGYAPPHYPSCLNAMHEAEKVLTGEQAWQYVQLLAVEGEGWCATATQRAEAFLKTLGLWKE